MLECLEPIFAIGIFDWYLGPGGPGVEIVRVVAGAKVRVPGAPGLQPDWARDDPDSCYGEFGPKARRGRRCVRSCF